MPTSLGAQRGYSLIEVLVSVTILMIGLLGLAGLQAASLRWTADASQQAAAARLAQELAEKIRAQPGEVERYVAAAAGTPAIDADCYRGVGCSVAARVATDLAEWRAQAAGALPGGFATLCRDATPGDGSIASPGCSGGALDPLVMKFWWAARDTRGRSTEAAALSAPVVVLPLRP
jgi:type IV pilus assembly protein PilV